MRKGFTLIEMMIVVAIIAIIAAIAIPSLLAARRSSLETNATGSCRAYAEAQTIFKRNDWDGDLIMEYAGPANQLGPSVTATGQVYADPYGAFSFSVLYGMTDADQNKIQLVDSAFAGASTATVVPGPPPTGPKHGYYFEDLVNIEGTNGNIVIDWVNDYGLSAAPAVYGRTGYRSFIISANGTTFGQDLGPGVGGVGVHCINGLYPADPSAGGWVISE